MIEHPPNLNLSNEEYSRFKNAYQNSLDFLECTNIQKRRLNYVTPTKNYNFRHFIKCLIIGVYLPDNIEKFTLNVNNHKETIYMDKLNLIPLPDLLKESKKLPEYKFETKESYTRINDSEIYMYDTTFIKKDIFQPFISVQIKNKMNISLEFETITPVLIEYIFFPVNIVSTKYYGFFVANKEYYKILDGEHVL